MRIERVSKIRSVFKKKSVYNDTGIERHSNLSKIAQDIEIGVPDWKPGQVKIIRDREKPPKYTPRKIILPVRPEEGKVIEVPSGKPEPGTEKGVPPNVAKRIDELFQLLEDNEKKLDKLNERLERMYKKFKEKTLPLEREKKQLQMSYEAIAKELFRLYNENKIKIVKAKQSLYTIRAQQEKTGRLTTDRAKKVLENLLKALEVENLRAEVLKYLEEMMGDQLVILIDRIAEITEEINESGTNVEASVRLGISIRDLFNKVKNLISSVVNAFREMYNKLKDLLSKSDEQLEALKEVERILETA